jgi:hypothetical protein
MANERVVQKDEGKNLADELGNYLFKIQKFSMGFVF